jgi:hypothetical protein
MRRTALVSGLLIAVLATAHAQNQSAPADSAQPNQTAPAAVPGEDQSAPGSNPALTADYPRNQAGILIQGNDWTPVANQYPTKTKLDRGWAASLSYGVVPAKVVAEYDGEHALTQIDAAQPVVCICRFMSIPGAPVLVRLHPKKGMRELDGGRMTVYPIVGGSKVADAKTTDLIPADVSHPDPQIWLVRPQSPLDPGEYALMLGTQNMSIYPFTVVPAPVHPSAAN